MTQLLRENRRPRYGAGRGNSPGFFGIMRFIRGGMALSVVGSLAFAPCAHGRQKQESGPRFGMIRG